MEILFTTSSKNIEINKVDYFEEFVKRDNTLKRLSVDEIKNLYDQISKYLSSHHCKIKDMLLKNELGFIILWLKKRNIKKILELNFNDYSFLDSPKHSKNNDEILYARPLGNAVHWIAGNVPVLGVISLFQTLLTKNKSIVKVPNSFKNVLSNILSDLNSSDFFEGDIRNHLDI